MKSTENEIRKNCITSCNSVNIMVAFKVNDGFRIIISYIYSPVYGKHIHSTLKKEKKIR